MTRDTWEGTYRWSVGISPTHYLTNQTTPGKLTKPWTWTRGSRNGWSPTQDTGQHDLVHVDQVRELMDVLLPPHQRGCVKGHLLHSRVGISHKRSLKALGWWTYTSWWRTSTRSNNIPVLKTHFEILSVTIRHVWFTLSHTPFPTFCQYHNTRLLSPSRALIPLVWKKKYFLSFSDRFPHFSSSRWS
jgi:hypothetical protein